MTIVRRLLHTHPSIALAIVATALAMKLLVPAGFMPVFANGRIVVSICSGSAPATPMVMAMPGGHHMPDTASGHDPASKQDGGVSAPCAFAGLATPSIAAVDAVLLAAAILIAAKLALRPAPPPLVHPTPRLRPPLRGPPRPV